jgi:hypothetical protein
MNLRDDKQDLSQKRTLPLKQNNEEVVEEE